MRDSVKTLELGIDGMTCAACAVRLERRLNRLDGVDAVVSFATGRAQIRYEPDRWGAAALGDEITAAGFDAQAVEDVETALPSWRRVAWCATLAAPVLVICMAPGLPRYLDWLALAISGVVVFGCARPIHRAAWRGVGHLTLTMDTLVSLATLLAWDWTLVSLIHQAAMSLLADINHQVSGGGGMAMGGGGLMMVGGGATTTGSGSGMTMGGVTQVAGGVPYRSYFDIAVGIPLLVLLGRTLEARARFRASIDLRRLADFGNAEALRLDDQGREDRVPARQLVVGERVRVPPGELIPVDGIILEGRAAIDTAALTGESVPADRGPGDPVAAGTHALDGGLVIGVTASGRATLFGQIETLVRDALARKARVQQIVDRVCAVFVPSVIVLATVTTVGWLATGHGLQTSLGYGIAVLVVACPCALGLATPTALMVGMTRAARFGLLLRGPDALEVIGGADTIVLDKTGTVTTGTMSLADCVADGIAPEEMLRLAGALEQESSHPAALALGAAARRGGARLPDADEVRVRPGLGISGLVGGLPVSVGGAGLLRADELTMPESLATAVTEQEALGRSVTFVAVGGRVCGMISLHDTVRQTSAAAVAEFRRSGLEPILLTGDTPAAGQAVADHVGIQRVIAGVLPDEKADVIARLQTEGHRVIMVGDGINDAPALARADAGIALASGSDIAVQASDITIVAGGLDGAVAALKLGRAIRRTIRVNLGWAFAYNIVALPLAAFGEIKPLAAAAAMCCSSLLVVGNALRLRRFTWHPLTAPAIDEPSAEPAIRPSEIGDVVAVLATR